MPKTCVCALYGFPKFRFWERLSFWKNSCSCPICLETYANVFDDALLSKLCFCRTVESLALELNSTLKPLRSASMDTMAEVQQPVHMAQEPVEVEKVAAVPVAEAIPPAVGNLEKGPEGSLLGAWRF